MTGFSTLQVLLEDSGGTFTHNITQYTNLARGWDFRRGRNDEDDQVEVGTARFEMVNDGRFTLGAANYDGITVDKRIQVKETVGGTTYTRFTGYVQAWPTEWESPLGNYAVARITASDRQARLNRRKLRTMTEHEVLLDSPWAYYPLAEAAGALSAGDKSGNGAAAPLTFAGTGTAPVFGSTGFNTWDGETACLIAGANQYLTTNVAGTGLGLMVAFIHSVTLPLKNQPIAWLVNGISIWMHTAGGEISVHNAAGATVATSPLGYCDGLPHVAEVTAVSGGTWTLYVDGVSVATGAGGTIAATTTLEVAPNSGQSTIAAEALWGGTVGHVAAFSSTLSAARALAHASSILNGFSTERSDQRIARLAAYANVPTAQQNLETGTQTSVPVQSVTGQSVWDAMSEVMGAEGGVLFIAGDGKLTMHNRTHRVVKATGAAAVALTGADLEHTDLTFDGDKDYLINTATGTRQGGSEQRVVNAASLLKYEEYPKDNGNVLMTTDGQVLGLLQWQVGSYNEVASRVSTVTLNLTTLAQATVQALLALELGDLLTISSIPSQAPASSLRLIVEGVKEEQSLTSSSSKWQLVLNTAPASLFYAWVLGDSTYGVLGSTTKLHY